LKYSPAPTKAGGGRLRWLRSVPGLPGTNPRLKPAFWHEYFWLLTRLAGAVRSVAAEVEPGRHLLDIGAGSAPYRSILSTRASAYWAVDLPGVPRCSLHLHPEADLPFRPASVGVVLSSQVLEHVEDPARHLAEIRRVLSQDGSLVLSTHGTWIYHPHPKDFWRWTAAGLRKQVEAAGFEIVSFRGVLSMRATCAQIWQIQVQALWPSWLRPAFIALMQAVVAFEDWAGRKTRDADACTYVVHARPRLRNAHDPTAAQSAS